VFLVNLPGDNSSNKGNTEGCKKVQGALKVVKGPTFGYLLEKEFRILSMLDHPSIIKPIDYCQTGSKKSQSSYLCLPFYENGELFDYVKAKTGLCETNSRLYFKQVASAVKYLHGMNIAHRDIKLENILIDDDMNAKVIDFGFSYWSESISKSENTKDIQTRIFESNIEAQTLGTVGYMAPELLEMHDKGTNFTADTNENTAERFELLKAADIFALGVTLFIMVVGTAPFSSASKTDPNYRAFFLGKRKSDFSRFWGKHPKTKDMIENEELSDDFKSLIEGMLDPNLTERLRVNSIMKHSWLS
jgi:serine/threonine protein kinase